jgi:hypothetical protein
MFTEILLPVYLEETEHSGVNFIAGLANAAISILMVVLFAWAVHAGWNLAS